MAAQQEQGLTTYAGPQGLAIAPTDWNEIQRVFARMVSKSEDDNQVIATMIACKELGFNPVLNHVFLIKGSVYVSHKGLLNLAHRSGKFDGIELLEEWESDTHWLAKVAVHRKDMSRPFIYTGRYPKRGERSAYGPEMAVTRAETMALRRAFDVGLPVKEEIDALEGEYRVSEAAPARSAPVAIAAPREQAAVGAIAVPTPTILPDREFAQFLHDISQQAHDGIASADILKLLQTYNNHLSPEQHSLTGKLWKRIVAARKAGEPWPAPAPLADEPDDDADQEIIETEVQVVPQPQAVTAPMTDPGSQRATERQVRFIYAIALEAGLDVTEVNGWSEELYQCQPDQLTRRDAATLIEALQRRRNEVAPAPTTAAALAASDDPFGDGAPASIAG